MMKFGDTQPDINHPSHLAIFWDFDSYYDNIEVNITCAALFAKELLNNLNSFRDKTQLTSNEKLLLYVDLSATGNIDVAKDFTVVNTSDWTANVKKNMVFNIQLWLHDQEMMCEKQEHRWNPCVVIIAKDNYFLNFVAELFANGVFVVSVNDLADNELTVWRQVSSVLLHYDISNESRVNFHIVSSIDNSNPAQARAGIPRTMGNNFGDHPDACDYSTFYDFRSISEKQQQLVDELAVAIRSQNVKLTVSKLREIYKRQIRSYRIPLILETISQESGPDKLLSFSEIVYVLGCIQWCYGGQKGDNVDSFTYKMNKNIARWLLEDLQKKDLDASIHVEIFPVVLCAIHNILEQVVEFEFCFEILKFFSIENPLDVLSPQLYTWRVSDYPAQASRAKAFADKLESHVSYFRPPSIPDEPGCRSRDIVVVGSNIQTPLLAPSLQRHGSDVDRSNISDRRGTPLDYGASGGFLERQTILSPFFQQPLLPSPHFSQQPLLPPPPPSLRQFSSRLTTATAIPHSILHRIFLIISTFHHGVSGSMINEVYYNTYGEKLLLPPGKNLRDVMEVMKGVQITETGRGLEVFYKIKSAAIL